MGETILVESTIHNERVAILEQGRLAELYLERRRDRSLLGVILKGRVHRVLPGMQAAFVDAGLERDVFLYVDEVRRGLDVASGIDAWDDDEREEGEPAAEGPPIEALVKVGQELLVQVIKEPLANKGARVTTAITLPGRFLVYVPGASHRGISRRITDEVERERLRALLAELPPLEAGLIVRTAGQGVEAAALERDLAYLQRQHQRIVERASLLRSPSRVHQDLDLPARILRDRLGPGVDEVWIEGAETFAAAVEYVEAVEPALRGRLHQSKVRGALFARHHVERQIAAALADRVGLDSGGSLVIQQTEALVAIDVNSGRYVGRSNLQDTARTTNLEAAKEVARQIRLRNLAGIIVVDFIDMESLEHRAEVLAELETALAPDRARTRILAMSEFGLVEITRKRGRPSLERLLTRPCPRCSGRGRVPALFALALEVRRRALDTLEEQGSRRLELYAHPELIAALAGPERAILEELERASGQPIALVPEAARAPEAFDVVGLG
jgi:ribonuclease G